jgi:hypothetical protein
LLLLRSSFRGRYGSFLSRLGGGNGLRHGSFLGREFGLLFDWLGYRSCDLLSFNNGWFFGEWLGAGDGVSGWGNRLGCSEGLGGDGFRVVGLIGQCFVYRTFFKAA